jgi:glycerol-3-phosphate dehydrogenase
MAVHLEDVILRRTNLGSGSHPGTLALERAASLMQPLLGWTEAQRRAEVAATEAVLAHHLAAVPATPASAARRSSVAQ